MNILLNIPEEIVAKYQNEADKTHRSRKNLMESVLINYCGEEKSVTGKPEAKQKQTNHE